MKLKATTLFAAVSAVLLAGSATATTWYVDASHGSDEWNGNAADAPLASIREAVGRCQNGDVVIVSDGIYPPINVPDLDIRISSLNGAASTIIDGGGTNCCAVFASQRTALAGFTLVNGFSPNGAVNTARGGGATGGTLEDCVLTNNTAYYGGGATRAILKKCLILANKAVMRGGGAFSCRLESCSVIGNSIIDRRNSAGGALYGSGAINCLIRDNSSSQSAVFANSLGCVNCTIVNNFAEQTGCLSGNYRNCIIWGNRTGNNSAQPSGSYLNCCMDLLLGNDNGKNLYVEPGFADSDNGDFRLNGNSQCIDAGNTDYLHTSGAQSFSDTSLDLDGNARVVGVAVDIGCYEYPVAREVPVVKPTFAETWGAWSSETAPTLAMPESAATWDAFARAAWNARDAFVRSGARMEVPPSDAPVVLSLGAVSVPVSMIPDNGNGLKTEMEHGVAVWRLHMREDAPSGALLATIGGRDFSVADFPAYLPDAWTAAVYGDPPKWLSTDERAEWQTARRRDRIEWFATLVPDSDWALYIANRNAAADAVLADDKAPTLQFAGISPENGSEGVHAVTIRAAAAGEVRLFGTTNLASGAWNYEGLSIQPRGDAAAGAVSTNAAHFYRATIGGRDSDGDGIPDAVESLVLGTDPDKKETSGGGLTDWDRIYRYDLDPFVRDSAGDGMSDAEKIEMGMDPRVPLSCEEQAAAARSIRYTYDDDDRLTGTWFGLGGGSKRTTLSPAGNPETVRNDKEEE